MVRVKNMSASVDYQGKTYGPSAGPLDVPRELAAALGLVLEDDEQVTAPTPDPTSDRVTELERQLADAQVLLQHRQADLQSLLDSATAQLAQAQQERDAARVELATAQQEGSAAQAQLATVQEGLARAQADRDALHQEVAGLRQFAKESEQIFLPFAAEHGQEEDGLTAMRRLTDELMERRTRPPSLPADALERVIAVKGVGDKLGREILDALTK